MKKEPSKVKKAYAFGVLSIVLSPAPGLGLLLAVIGLFYHAQARGAVTRNPNDYKLGRTGRTALTYCMSGAVIGMVVLAMLLAWIFRDQVQPFIAEWWA